jgi:hypothetical protein
VLILQGLTAFLLVTVHSKEFIAHGKLHLGLTLVPRLASVENKKRQQDAGATGCETQYYPLLTVCDCYRFVKEKPFCQSSLEWA